MYFVIGGVFMKIGRNDPCPCGSGLKYKKCCIHREDNKTFTPGLNQIEYTKFYKRVKHNSEIKICLYPEQDNCEGKIVNAHSIQNNKILNRLADDGHVIMPNFKNGVPIGFGDVYGRKEATTFTGFCQKHDKECFQPIEDTDFVQTEQQIFLYTYRAFAFHYYKKITALNTFRNMFRNVPSKVNDEMFMQLLKGFELSIDDFKYDKAIFDYALLNEDFSVIDSIIWEFPQAYKFACSGFEALCVDFDNNVIQDLSIDNERSKHIFYTVFPESNTTYTIISILKKDAGAYKNVFYTLNALDNRQKINYLNNTILASCENIVINPTWWNKLDQREKDLIDYRFHEPSDNDSKFGFTRNRFDDTDFNFFKL